MDKLAVTIVEYRNYGPFTAAGTGDLGNSTNPIYTFVNVISVAIGIMTTVAVVWFIFIVLSSAIQIASSGNEKSSFEAAKKRMTSGLIGLVVTFSAIFILDIIANILGIQYVLLLSDFLQALF